MYDLSHVLSTSFALGSSAQNSDPVNIGVGPLSNEVKNGRRDHRSLRLALGEWSLVIIHLGPSNYKVVVDFQVVGRNPQDPEGAKDPQHTNKAYYAFVKCHGDFTDLSVHDLDGYLTEVGGTQAEQLKAMSGGWPGFHYYDRSDIYEALQKIYI